MFDRDLKIYHLDFCIITFIIVLFYILQDRVVGFRVPRKLKLKNCIHFIRSVKLPVSINTFC